MPSLTHPSLSLTHSLNHSLTDSLTVSLTHSLPYSLTPLLPHSFTHSITAVRRSLADEDDDVESPDLCVGTVRCTGWQWVSACTQTHTHTRNADWTPQDAKHTYTHTYTQRPHTFTQILLLTPTCPPSLTHHSPSLTPSITPSLTLSLSHSLTHSPTP
eukprot:GHVU01194603.1.p1 GENE.GHVU01194603.1~~GHVU01194603.1.p1  ORF type:complete len:158 (+),score=0.08 GHVU01194603.1:268-741(+)